MVALAIQPLLQLQLSLRYSYEVCKADLWLFPATTQKQFERENCPAAIVAWTVQDRRVTAFSRASHSSH